MRKFYLPLALLVATASLPAATFLYTSTSATGCGAAPGEPCSAQALFTVVNAHEFTITLTNTTNPIHDAGQLLTDVEFTIAQGGTVTEKSSNGTIINIAGNGSFSVVTTGETGWGFGNNQGAGLTAADWMLCVICGTSGVSAAATPTHGIVDAQSNYASADGSIDGNSGHDPFMESGATFTFDTSVTLDTTGVTDPFSKVFLSFGTGGGDEIGTNLTTPEPVSLLLVGGGLLSLGLLRRRATS
jgi:hypothetical protein